jgi:dethiobiotin synthetase
MNGSNFANFAYHNKAHQSPTTAAAASPFISPRQTHPPGIFITGTDTGVGKTVVAALIARQLRELGLRVGVYKPAASGCRVVDGDLISDDALMLWEAAGRPETLAAVCPQKYLAPLAPHLAARAEGHELLMGKLRSGLEYWRERSDVVIVEGAGGLLSPLGDHDYVLDLAHDCGYPIVIVTKNVLGTIHQTLATCFAAQHARGGIPVLGVILNEVAPRDPAADPSVLSNADELRRHLPVPLLAELPYEAANFTPPLDWKQLLPFQPPTSK